MGMCIRENGRTSAVLNKDLQDAVGIAAFLASRIELSVAIGSCPTLAKAIIALGVNVLFRPDAGNVFLPFTNILATLYHNRFQSKFNETQSRKQSARTSAHNNDRRPFAHIFIDVGLKVLQRRLLAHISPYSQIDENGSLASINTTFDDPYGLGVDTLFLAKISQDALLVISLLRQNTQVQFIDHSLLTIDHFSAKV